MQQQTITKTWKNFDIVAQAIDTNDDGTMWHIITTDRNTNAQHSRTVWHGVDCGITQADITQDAQRIHHNIIVQESEN